MTLWTFSKTNPWFNVCFKFLMYIKYSSLSCKFVTSFSIFSIYILSGKRDKSFWSSCNFFKILNISLKKISIINIIIVSFYEIFVALPIHTNYLCSHTWNMGILYFYHNFHAFIISLHILTNRIIFRFWYLFLPLIIYQYQLKDLISLWSFLRLLAMLILVWGECEQDEAHIF